MKKIEAIINPFKLEEVMDALEEFGMRGMTVTEVKGLSRQKCHTEIFRGSEYSVDFLPRLKLDMVVSDQMVDAAIETIIRSGGTGKNGEGEVLVSIIEAAVRIRTAETGDLAI